MRDLKIIALTVLAVLLYQSMTPSDWRKVHLKVKRIVTAVLQ